MKAFVSWSGGKDCMLALHRFLKNPKNKVDCLINMCNSEGTHSRSHGIKKQLIQVQANCMEIPIIQKATNKEEYAKKFKDIINELKNENIDTGVFGDIYLKEHRIWIEQLCNEMGIMPVFPLWETNTTDLLKEFINEGFKAIVVAINNIKLTNNWLERIIDNEFLDDVIQLKNIDPSAENGEYHSYVYDGPLFKKPVSFTKGKIHAETKNNFVELILK